MLKLTYRLLISRKLYFLVVISIVRIESGEPAWGPPAFMSWSLCLQNASRIYPLTILPQFIGRYNKFVDEFSSLREYNDYLENVEDISASCCGEDVSCMRSHGTEDGRYLEWRNFEGEAVTLGSLRRRYGFVLTRIFNGVLHSLSTFLVGIQAITIRWKLECCIRRSGVSRISLPLCLRLQYSGSCKGLTWRPQRPR